MSFAWVKCSRNDCIVEKASFSNEDVSSRLRQFHQVVAESSSSKIVICVAIL